VGHYVFVCNEAGHAHLGMAIDFTVRALPDRTGDAGSSYSEAYGFGQYFRQYLGGLTTTI
jgi:hypothetical protein